MLMIHIKKYYEGVTNEEIHTERYNSLQISPVHITRTRRPTRTLSSRSGMRLSPISTTEHARGELLF